MKYIFYLSMLVILCACNSSEKKESAQAVIPTPTGLQGLQKSNVAQPVAQQTKSNLIFNPPHGEAGHTCTLAVGAPLNPTASVQPQRNTNPKPAAASAIAAVNTSGKKLNPKHGEPGHRCDIAVGAPLDSKPTQVVTTTQPAVTQVSGVKVGKGLNPPHGQPNHRCDLAVGAPLNSKPAQVANPAPIPTPDAKTTETKVVETKSEG
ncbi:hypothetical protein [Pedobacter alluvionis]|uniref:Uncharacterized protein n=1 Tax=Pedobacter alluvionis TaxID=475253 RepID=A0A497XY75_9SPHI|nr:hypothetical protein [Pedobacter alluvionis]RLJ73849.1 hypothetical protein BCL90_4014 [Pedobacter alluvionis]TFB32538.1 hypothetical protein E3V97_00445 [Pedobacter alluvionis]